jgi:hypothetical protein
MRNAICFATPEDFMVLRQAVAPSHRFGAQLRSPRRRRAEAEQSQGGNCLYEHHHGHDERAEARA